MAVLKSPRNNRKKGQWAVSYATSVTPTFHQLNEAKDARAKHNLHKFLKNSSHWVSTTGDKQGANFWLPEYVEGIKPPVYIKYGRNTFNASSVQPLIFRSYFRSKHSSQRFNALINSDHLVSSLRRIN